MLSVEQVLGIIEEKIERIGPCRLPIAQALGAILAEPVMMDRDSPPFDRAVLDGFAIHTSPEAMAWEQIGQADAGGSFSGVLGAGQCVGINTGAPVPEGANAVLMVEESVRRVEGGRTYIQAKKWVPLGYGIQKRGADARGGDLVLSAGTRLGPGELAVCATAGAGQVAVRRLRAGILTTGDELVSVGQIPAAGQIRNSNNPLLCGLLHEAAATHLHDGSLLDLGICPDDEARLRERLSWAMDECDLLIVTGGMSMGTRDLVPHLLKELGVDLYVEKVRMKPGKPFILGKRQASGRTSYVAGLPGNPVSAYVTFQRFVRVAISRMLGERAGERLVEAQVSAPLPANGDREFYQPCRLSQEGAALVAEPLEWKGSADLFTLAQAQGLMIRPVSAPAAAAGALIRVLVPRGMFPR